jgi:hypothetical protein
LTEDRFGNLESAYDFNGNDRIEVPTNEIINSEFMVCVDKINLTIYEEKGFIKLNLAISK